MHRAPRQGGVEVGALGTGEREMFGLTVAAHTACGCLGGLGEPCAVGGVARADIPASVIAPSAKARMLSSRR
jgi:hypothetical protein